MVFPWLVWSPAAFSSSARETHENWWVPSGNSLPGIDYSMAWFEGKSTGNHGNFQANMRCLCRFSLKPIWWVMAVRKFFGETPPKGSRNVGQLEDYLSKTWSIEHPGNDFLHPFEVVGKKANISMVISLLTWWATWGYTRFSDKKW